MAQRALKRGLALTSLLAIGACNSILGNKEHPLANSASGGDPADAGANSVPNSGSSGAENNGGTGTSGGGAPPDLGDNAGESAGGAAGGGLGTGGSTATAGAGTGGASHGGSGGTMNGGTGGTINGAGTGGAIAGGGAGGAVGGAGGAPPTRSDGPCDAYAAASTPCAAAYSMIRGLRKAYNGPLYQVRKGGSIPNSGMGGVTADIGMTADGFADSAAQDSFCSGSICTVSVLYDHSGNKNDLKAAPGGVMSSGPYSQYPDFESHAAGAPLMVGGHYVYSLFMMARDGYRLTAVGTGMPTGSTGQGIYMLADGTHYGTECCWDFGNVSTDPTKYHTSNALFLGTGFWGKGAEVGPWFLGNFEAGLWSGGAQTNSSTKNLLDPSVNVAFAFGILKTGPGNYALRAANLATATDLTTAYDGTAPKVWDNQGGIVLGVDSDNGNNSWGTFYEGAITAGRPTDATDLAVMKNVQAAKYGQ